MGQDKVPGRAFARRPGSMPVMREEQGLVLLGPELPDSGSGTVRPDSDGSRAQCGCSPGAAQKYQNQRPRWVFLIVIPRATIMLFVFCSEGYQVIE